MSLHPSLRRPAPRSDVPIAPAPTSPSRIKEGQGEVTVHEPPRVRHPAPITGSHAHIKAKAISLSSTTQPPPSSYSVRAHIQSQPEEFLKNVFPNERQIRYREQLFRDVISTGWWLYNEMEPQRELCAFIPRMTDNHFQCTSCGKKVRFFIYSHLFLLTFRKISLRGLIGQSIISAFISIIVLINVVEKMAVDSLIGKQRVTRLNSIIIMLTNRHLLYSVNWDSLQRIV